ncbi:ankyrin repeat domain-containing protein [Blastopirellula marina]|uniref:ankyrin repeat domain-containing protein n=1 Tax=Blastopirellula marina TaxID=124 RepID=UPI001304EB01|nr:ankyrin repeat domain-containing protein [Blastopirellula marina]
MNLAKKRQLEFVQFLLARKFEEAERLLAKGASVHGAVDGEFPIHDCARATRSTKPLQWLLSQPEVDLNPLSSQQLTPLMIACSNGGKIGSDAAELLLEAGAAVKYRRSDGMSALEFAAKNCRPSIVRSLVAKGLPINGPRGCDQTPAMLAARSDNLECLKTLEELGADLSRKCKLPWAKGYTCLELAEAEKSKKVIAYLRAK